MRDHDTPQCAEVVSDGGKLSSYAFTPIVGGALEPRQRSNVSIESGAEARVEQEVPLGVAHEDGGGGEITGFKE